MLSFLAAAAMCMGVPPAASNDLLTAGVTERPGNILGPLAPPADGVHHNLLGPLSPRITVPPVPAPRSEAATLPAELESLWPAGVERLAGLQMYPVAQHSQRLAIENGRSSDRWYRRDQDDLVPGTGIQANPNRTFPYAVSGGLHNSTGWESIKAARIPGPVSIWTEAVPVPMSSTPLPKFRWAFPTGTVFVDMLAKDGRCFELRTATKGDDGRWKREFVHRDLDAAPEGYHGAGMACASCHKDAGASQQYGITVRGDDSVFSWTPFVDGTFQRRSDVAFVRGKPSAAPSVASARSTEIEWLIDYAEAVRDSQETGRALVIDFQTADCVHCRKMEATTFQDPAVKKLIAEHFIALQVDGEQSTKLAERFGVRSYPTLVFARPDGTIVRTVEGFLDAQSFQSALRQALPASPAVARRMVVMADPAPQVMAAPRMVAQACAT
jgi:thiol-disulfide isomerase/thioredoxin